MLGAQRTEHVTPRMLQLLQDQWARLDPHFDAFRTAYNNTTYSRQPGADLAKWTPPPHLLSNKHFNPNWQKMSSKVREVSRITLDGILFRTELHEKHYNLKTRNSSVQCHVNIDNRVGQQRNARSGEEICYGVIQRFYLHFQWPPTRAQLKAARVSKRSVNVDPSRVPVPFMVVADCRWYRAVGHEKVSHLKVVKAWPAWDEDCPISDVRNWFAMNIALWPARWSEKTDMSREGGDVDDDDEYRRDDDDDDDDDDHDDDDDEDQGSDGGARGAGGATEKHWLKSHRVVITHHETEPTLARRR